MSKKVLILSGAGDLHAYAVREALELKGVEAELWHTPDFPSRSRESLLYEAESRILRVEGPEVDWTNPQFDVVWRRRPSFRVDETRLHPADVQFAEVESGTFRQSLLGLLSPGAFWVNPLEMAVKAARKMVQHELAREIGFRMPDTLYSNDPREIRAFLRRKGGQIIYKPIRGIPWQKDDVVWMPYTCLIGEEHLVSDLLLQSVPGIYQAFVPKAYELRVTAMGQRLLSAKILSQETRCGRLDWRKAPDELRMVPFEVTPRVASQCLELLERLGLVFGCFDFIITPEGDYIFLEVNEMGQFLFVEDYTGLPMLDVFCEFLAQGSRDFEWSESAQTVRFSHLKERVRELAASSFDIHVAPPENASEEKYHPSRQTLA